MPNTFIKAAEVWIPSADGSLLDFNAGAFGPARSFAALSRSMCFGRGEGLPGRAWEEGSPVMLAQFEGSYFRRSTAALAAGLSCAVAVPLFVRGALTSVLVLFCGHAPGLPGALELWQQGTDPASDMTLVDGAYGAKDSPAGPAVALETASRRIAMPRGTGLPGLAWLRGEALLMDDLAAESGRFLRAQQALEAGLLRGFALPVGGNGDGNGDGDGDGAGGDSGHSGGAGHVITFLAGAALPLAQRIERWVPGDDAGTLRRAVAFSELHGGHSKAEASLPATMAGGAIATAWAHGVPAINEDPRSEPGAVAAAASGLGAAALLAIPVVLKGAVVEVVALYL